MARPKRAHAGDGDLRAALADIARREIVFYRELPERLGHEPDIDSPVEPFASQIAPLERLIANLEAGKMVNVRDEELREALRLLGVPPEARGLVTGSYRVDRTGDFTLIPAES